jgi:hypothetical protein
MVWMRMGQDDKIDLFRRYPISVHLLEEVGNVTGMTRIDKDCDLSVDEISVAVIFICILPKVGIEVFFKLHPNELPVIFSTP